MGNYDIFNKSYELISHCCNHISPAAASLTQLTNILIVTVFRIAIIFEDCIELDDSPGYSILYHSYSIQLVTGCPTDCCYDQVKPDKCNRVARCDIPPIPHTMAVSTCNNEGAFGWFKIETEESYIDKLAFTISASFVCYVLSRFRLAFQHELAHTSIECNASETCVKLRDVHL